MLAQSPPEPAVAVPTRRRLAGAVAGVALLGAVAAAGGVPGRATYGARVTADEPHYLLTALSLAEDASLDVSDEIAADRYRPFHEVDLLQQARVRDDGTQVVPHDPLLPLLLAPAVAAAGWLGGKALLVVVAAVLAGLTCWLAVRRFAVPLGAAAAVTGVFAASAPLAVYGQQVYPELPAALAVSAAAVALTGPLGRGGLVALALAVTALPWLAVKYVPVAAVLTAIALVALWRQGRRGAAAVLLAALALAAVVYAVAHLAWYGGLTVYAAGEFFAANGGQLSVIGTDPQVLGRARRLLGLLVDAHFGLAAWQPAWLLAVPALAALLRRRPHGWPVVVAPLAAGWLVATFVALTMHGWWFPGRQVVVVLPLAVVAIAWWAGRVRWRLAAAAGSGLLGVWSHAWLAVQAATVRLTWVVDPFATADPWYRAWHRVLPVYWEVNAATWVLHGVWLVLLSAAAVLAWRRAALPFGSAGRRS